MLASRFGNRSTTTSSGAQLPASARPTQEQDRLVQETTTPQRTVIPPSRHSALQQVISTDQTSPLPFRRTLLDTLDLGVLFSRSSVDFIEPMPLLSPSYPMSLTASPKITTGTFAHCSRALSLHYLKPRKRMDRAA